LQRPLTLSEKILYGHLDDPQNQVSTLLNGIVIVYFLKLMILSYVCRPIYCPYGSI